MRVLVMSKRQFNDLMVANNITDENVEQRDKVVFISIHDTSNENYQPHFKEDHSNVMTLRFDDVENEGETSPTNKGKCKVFDEEMAEKLYEFIKRNKDKETGIIHCFAGISRSGAIGSFINGYTGGDYDLFKRENPQIAPNARVMRMLHNAKYKDLGLPYEIS